MNWDAISFDWNQIKVFLATAEEGSLSAAARALKSTQPTVGRQLSCLEESLGITLFERSPRALTLTSAGKELMEHVRIMGDAAMRISLSASGQSSAVEGHVVITAADMLTTYLMPTWLIDFRQQAPGITVQLSSSNKIRDIIGREADIAIRHAEPKQDELIAKYIGEFSGGFYASHSYIEKHKNQICEDNIGECNMVAYDQVEEYLPILKSLNLDIKKENFKLTTNEGASLLEMVKKGLGVSMLPDYIAQRESELRQILPAIRVPIPIWLVTHKELHTSKRIRVMFDFLAEKLKEM